jgi:hypothetical protein
MRKGIVILLLGLLNSCEKFEYTDQQLLPCTLCDFAESINGTYRGHATGINVPSNSDSVTVTVQQIFLGNSHYEDSTILCFVTKQAFDQYPTYIITDTVQIKSPDGEVISHSTSIDLRTVKRISPSEMDLSNMFYDGIASMQCRICGILYKQ